MILYIIILKISNQSILHRILSEKRLPNCFKKLILKLLIIIKNWRIKIFLIVQGNQVIKEMLKVMGWKEHNRIMNCSLEIFKQE